MCITKSRFLQRTKADLTLLNHMLPKWKIFGKQVVAEIKAGLLITGLSLRCPTRPRALRPSSARMHTSYLTGSSVKLPCRRLETRPVACRRLVRAEDRGRTAQVRR